MVFGRFLWGFLGSECNLRVNKFTALNIYRFDCDLSLVYFLLFSRLKAKEVALIAENNWVHAAELELY